MKVRTDSRIFIVCFTGGSGITHYSISLARELSQYAKVTLVVGKNYCDQGYPSFEFDVLPFFNRSRWYLIDLLRLALFFVINRPQVALFQSTLKSALMESILIRFFGMVSIRTAMTIHDVLPHYPKPWSRLTHIFLYRAFDQLIVHSQRSWDDLREMKVMRPLLMVPHGLYSLFITHPSSCEESRINLTPFTRDHFVLLFFGKIDERKGIWNFLELRRALSTDDRYRFVIAGRMDISYKKSELQVALEEARASSNCIVHNHDIPFMEVQNYFALADIVILPYQEGTTSGVLKLALAFGKPVVATDVGDLAEAVKEGVGILLPVKFKLSDLALAVNEIKENYDSYADACELAKERYDWGKIGKGYAHFLLDPIPKNAVSSEKG